MIRSSKTLRPWILLVAGPCRHTGEDYCGRVSRVLRGAAKLGAIDRTSLIVLEEEQPWWRPIADRFEIQNVVEQPFDRGSGTGVLVALLPIAERGPSTPLLVVEAQTDGRALQHRSSAAALLDRFAHAQPGVLAEVEHHRMVGAGLDLLYPFLPWIDLERDVLGPSRTGETITLPAEIGHRESMAFDYP